MAPTSDHPEADADSRYDLLGADRRSAGPFG
jgi:hypothetical protein